MKKIILACSLIFIAATFAQAEVTGGPASAIFTPNIGLSDDFEDGVYADRYQIRGVFAPDSSVSESMGSLTIDAGTAVASGNQELQHSLVLGDNRVIYPSETESFTATIKIAIHPSASGSFIGGLSLLKHDSLGSNLLLLGFVQGVTFDGQVLRAAISTWDGGNSVPVNLPDGQYVDVNLDYVGGLLTASIPEFGFSVTHFLGFEQGFSIGMLVQSSFQTSDFVEDPADRGIFTFDNLESNLVSDVYRVSATPLSNNGVLYSDSPANYEGGDLTTVWFNAPSAEPAVVTVDNTNLSLNGSDNIHAYLVTRLGLKHTLYTQYPLPVVLQVIGPDGTVDAVAENALIAQGFGNDYVWNLGQAGLPNAIPESCGIACGPGYQYTPKILRVPDISVNLETGNLYHFVETVAFSSREVGPQLRYNSRTGSSVLGKGWSHSGMRRLRKDGSRLFFLAEGGNEIAFSFRVDLAAYVPEFGCCNERFIRATESGNGFLVEQRGGIYWKFSVTGQFLGRYDLNGNVWTIHYDAFGRISDYSDPFGRTYSFVYNEDGFLYKIIAPLGEAQLSYVDGLLTKVIDARGAIEEFSYDMDGRLISLVDKAGFNWKYVYNTTSGNLISITDANLAAAEFSYSPGKASFSDSTGLVIEQAYSSHVVTKLVDPRLGTTAFYYNYEGDVTAIVDDLGSKVHFEYDVLHNRLAHSTTSTTRMEYNDFGQRTKLTFPLGNEYRYIYDDKANLIEIQVFAAPAASQSAPSSFFASFFSFSSTPIEPLPLSNEIFHYDVAGNMILKTDKRGFQTSYSYLQGEVVSTTNALGETELLERNQAGRLVATTDALGNKTTLWIDALGREVKTTFPDLSITEYLLDGFGRRSNLLQSSSPADREIHWEYDHNGKMIRATDSNGAIRTHTYDSEGRLSLTQRYDGSIVSYFRDDNQRLVGHVDSLGKSMSVSYDNIGQVLTSDDGVSSVSYSYDSSRRLTQLTKGSFSESYEYDANGNLRIVETNGQLTKYEYDAFNQQTRVEASDGAISERIYDLAGNVILESDSLGYSSQHEYDALNRLLASTDSLGAKTALKYDQRSLPIEITDPKGNIISVEYDLMKRPVILTQPNGDKWQVKYDSNGRIVQQTNPIGETESLEYNAFGWLTAIIDGIGRRTSYSYDLLGNVSTKTLPDGTSILSTYSEGGLLTSESISGVDDSTRRYIRDSAENIVRFVDEKGAVYRYEYDDRGLLSAFVDPLENRTAHIRDTNGDITKTTLPSGKTVEYAFDDRRRLTGKILTNSGEDTATVDYRYDMKGQIISEIFSQGAIEVENVFEYDPIGNVIKQTSSDGYSMLLGWDANGNRTGTSVPEIGYDVTYLYDSLNQMVAMTAEGNTWHFEYDKAGRRTSTFYPDGSAKFASYSDAGETQEEWALSIEGEVLFSKEHTYNIRGQLDSTISATDATSYYYDQQDRLTGFDVINKQGSTLFYVRYTYDVVGNLVGQEIHNPSSANLPFKELVADMQTTPALARNVSIAYEYNDAGQLMKESVVVRPRAFNKPAIESYEVVYTWGPDGELIDKIVERKGGQLNISEFGWTSEGGLSSHSIITKTGEKQVRIYSSTVATCALPDTIPLVTIGADGIRSSVVYDRDSREILAKVSDGKIEKMYFGPNRDEMLSVVGESGSLALYSNFRNDIIAAAQSGSGYSIDYLPTGLPFAAREVTGTPGPSIRFQGKERLLTGLYDFNNRFLDGSVGRFISRDPLMAKAQMFEPYSFARNNSLNYTDPDGLCTTNGCGSDRSLLASWPYLSDYFFVDSLWVPDYWSFFSVVPEKLDTYQLEFYVLEQLYKVNFVLYKIETALDKVSFHSSCNKHDCCYGSCTSSGGSCDILLGTCSNKSKKINCEIAFSSNLLTACQNEVKDSTNLKACGNVAWQYVWGPFGVNKMALEAWDGAAGERRLECEQKAVLAFIGRVIHQVAKVFSGFFKIFNKKKR